MDSRHGYAGQILKVNLSTGQFNTVPTGNYADRFLGGRGIALKIYWDEVLPQIDAFDPENCLIFMTGPICGVPGFAGSRWQVCGKSPILNQFSYANLGGAWGARLKFAGYDGLVLKGKADSLVYLSIHHQTLALKDASHLKGRGAIASREILKDELGDSFCIVTTGPAGENMVTSATLLADSDSSGSSGFGALMGAKNIKAIAVSGLGTTDVADKKAVKLMRERVRQLKFAPFIWPTTLPQERMEKEVCFGCINGCMRVKYNPAKGRSGKYCCQSAGYYEVRAQRFYGEVTDVSFQATKLCDDYGIDTRAVETMMMWLSRCHKAHILSDDEIGLPLSQMGSLEFIQTLLRKIAFREGFGDVLAEGTRKAAKIVGSNADQYITDYMIKTGEDSPYGPRMHITTGLLYATEPRMPIQQLHEVGLPVLLWALRAGGNSDALLKNNYMTSEAIRAISKKFWGDEIAADFSTFKGKALSAAKIQDRQYAKESLILCDFSWPITHSPITDDHVGDPTLESRVCSAVTGMDMDETELDKIGQRAFNLQRAVLAREGRIGRSSDIIEEFNFTIPLKTEFGNPDCIVPGRNGEVFSRKGMVLDRQKFEKMKDEYYALRGWDISTGLQTKTKLEALGLGDIAKTLQQEDLLA
ncbi:MAG: aldehyde ferredoxin oxidoreductase N-terminal domain-containing protein [Desulfobacterales bacterium]